MTFFLSKHDREILIEALSVAVEDCSHYNEYGSPPEHMQDYIRLRELFSRQEPGDE